MNTREAIERIKTRFDKWALDDEDMKAIQTLIPELAESEDEKTRKAIVELVERSGKILSRQNEENMLDWLERQKKPKKVEVREFADGLCDKYPINKASMPDEEVSAYHQGIHFGVMKAVEHFKQKGPVTTKDLEYARNEGWNAGYETGKKEQQPAEWSEEDEKIWKDIFELCNRFGYDDACRKLKSLRPQPKQEWSEEEKGILLECVSTLQNSSHWLLADKLSFLRPYPHWKPSEEQMAALFAVIPLSGQPCTLQSLYNDLKKL